MQQLPIKTRRFRLVVQVFNSSTLNEESGGFESKAKFKTWNFRFFTTLLVKFEIAKNVPDGGGIDRSLILALGRQSQVDFTV